MKIAIIRLHGAMQVSAALHIADRVLATNPESEVHFVTSPEFVNLAERYTSIKQVHAVQGDIAPLVLQLLKEKLSACIDLQCNSRTFYIRTYLRQQYNTLIDIYKYPCSRFARWRGQSNQLQASLTTAMLRCIDTFNLKPQAIAWRYPLTEQDALKKDDLPTSHSGGFYCVELSSTNKEVVAGLAQASNYPLVLIGSKELSAEANQIAEQNMFKAYNAIAKFSDAETVEILARSRGNIVVTEAMAALAACTGKPIVTTSTIGTALSDLAAYSNGKIKTLSAKGTIQELLNAVQGFW
jgi:ADP-heptose:LPS heptosyltransferase